MAGGEGSREGRAGAGPAADADALATGFARARAAAGPGVPAAWLHVGDDAIAIVAGEGAEAARTVCFDAGPARVAATAIRRTPPSALEIETAIEHVEDALMRRPAGAAGVRTLHAADARIRALAAAAGVARLDADALERLFDRLAARAQGRPATQDALPVDPLSAATLVVLRELVHHQRVDAIVVLD